MIADGRPLNAIKIIGLIIVILLLIIVAALIVCIYLRIKKFEFFDYTLPLTDNNNNEF